MIDLLFTTIKSPLPKFIYDDIEEFSKGANRYSFQQKDLRQMLANKHGVSIDNIYLVGGIDYAIHFYALLFGHKTYGFTPTYIEHERMVDAIEGRNFKGIDSLTDDLNIDIDTSEKDDATLIFLANPNNPGGFTPKEKVIELVKNNPNAVVAIDEAYGEFASELSMIDQIEKYPNLSVFRSFSKDYGMAGNRIGYIVSSPETIKKIKEVDQWFTVSYLSVGAAISALNHEEYFENMRNEIIETREDFYTFLIENNFKVFNSKINALTIKFNSTDEGQKFYEYLFENDIKTTFGGYGSVTGFDETFVRLAIGTKKQMEVVKDVISKFN